MKNYKTKHSQSSALIRFGIAFVLLSVILAVGAEIGADNLFLNEGGSRSKFLKGESKPGSSRPTHNFDIRLEGSERVAALFRERAIVDPDQLITSRVLKNKALIDQSFAKLKAVRKNAEIDLSFLTGAVEIVRSADGLTRPERYRTGEDIVREFISVNRGLYGLDEGEIANLNFIGESLSPDSGIRMVRVEQIVNDRPVFQSETRFILDREGRVIRSLGSMVPSATETAELLEDLLSPQEALQRTMAQFNVPLEVEKMTVVRSDEDGWKTEMRVDSPDISGTVTSKLVYFPVAPGVLTAAWSQIVFGVDEDWYVLADARDGTRLWGKQIREDASTHNARFRVYVQADGITPADNPAPQSPSAALPGGGTQYAGIAPTIVSMFLAQNLTASPNGWIDDCPGGVCTANETQTLGNNAIACLDRAAPANACDTDLPSILDGTGRPTGNPDASTRNRDFLGIAPRNFETNFLPPPQGGNPEAGQTATGAGASGTNAFDQFRRASVVQQFYNANWYHDRMFLLGFDPAAGNFQNNNFGGGGLNNDRVLIDVQDASGTDNANFATPPDGTSGRAQMFRFTGPTIDRDGGLDAEILIHELTHGTSNRLVGNAAGLQWRIGQGMGEGWSDFYAMALLNNTNADDPNGNYAVGAYATYKAFGFTTYLDNYVYGIRRFPYSTVNTVNPLTWADVDQTTFSLAGGIAPSPLNFSAGGALQVHNTGEIWANTLWEVRSRIIAANAGNVPVGNQIALQIVTDGMKLTPSNPTFIQARDALIDADCAANACANEESIWNGFADRGLGFKASAPIAVQFGFTTGTIGIVESFAAPNLDTNTVTVSDAISNGSGFIDPDEPVRILVNIRNPWRQSTKTATGVTATISSSTPGVSIVSGSTNYPDIAPNSNADKIPAAANLVVRAPAAGVCGNRLNFTLTITSSLGSVARDFSLRMGAPSGTLAPVIYTRSALGLAIPDNTGAGVIDSMNITDDYEIADLNVRIDSLTHTFVTDVSFGVRGPSGYGANFLALTGQSGVGAGNGQNFVNTIIDDEALNNLLTVSTAQAPYTNSYFPVFNAPQWTTLIGASPDPVPQLSRFDGTSTLGTWRALVSDQFGGDTGTLQSWSLIVTPRAFVCTPFAPTAANVGVSGRVTNAGGRPISGAIVTLTDASGMSRYVRSSSFGYFGFDDIPTGRVYLLNVQAKGYSFEPVSLQVVEDVTELEVRAQ